MTKLPKAAPAPKGSAQKSDTDVVEDANLKDNTASADKQATTANPIPASEATGGGGDPATSHEAPAGDAANIPHQPQPDTTAADPADHPDDSSNDVAQSAPATTVESTATGDALHPKAPELVAGTFLPEAPEEVICRVRSVGGPRRRAGLAFDTEARSLTRTDLGGTGDKIEATLKQIIADPRLSLLPPTA